MNFAFERPLWDKGIRYIAGVDEAGRGPLAGPVVAAAVILSPDLEIKGLNDSKKLSPARREALYKVIKETAIGIGFARVSNQAIDRTNIWRANLLAMKKAVEDLPFPPEYIFIDGPRHRIELDIPQVGIKEGDARCASVAAASIVAKVLRDRIMVAYHRKYPDYCFNAHKGYGTKKHFKLLREIGPCPIHRFSFYPLKQK